MPRMPGGPADTGGMPRAPRGGGPDTGGMPRAPRGPADTGGMPRAPRGPADTGGMPRAPRGGGPDTGGMPRAPRGGGPDTGGMPRAPRGPADTGGMPRMPRGGGPDTGGMPRAPRGPADSGAMPVMPGAGGPGPGADDDGDGPYRWRPGADESGVDSMPAFPRYAIDTDAEPQADDFPRLGGPGGPGRPGGPPRGGPGRGGPGGRRGGTGVQEPSPFGQGGMPRRPRGEDVVPGFDDDRGGRGGRGRGGRPRRRGRLLAPMLAVILLVVLGIGGFVVFKRFQSKDFSGSGTGNVTVQVLKGDTATSLAPRLVKAGVVASTSSFVAAAKASSNPTGLEPGFFRMHLHMNSALAYKLLLTPSARIQTLVTIPEGLRLTTILSDLEKAHTSIPAADFAAAIKNTNALGLPSYANGNPEGFLFPATYTITPNETALQVLQQMVARFKQEASSINLPAAAKKGNLTENQVITVASILMAEGGNPKYYPQIAEVIYNRLNQGTPLQLDSTVNFALAKTGIGLTAAQLKVQSPYNTFIHKGLPPGPIDSPGDTAIKAALHPDHGNLTFFVTVNLKTGLTEFTNSPARFQQLVALCRKNKAC